jgi:hypothetical protein
MHHKKEGKGVQSTFGKDGKMGDVRMESNWGTVQ